MLVNSNTDFNMWKEAIRIRYKQMKYKNNQTQKLFIIMIINNLS